MVSIGLFSHLKAFFPSAQSRVALQLPCSCSKHLPPIMDTVGKAAQPHTWKQVPYIPQPTENRLQNRSFPHTALCSLGNRADKKDEAVLANPQPSEGIHSKTRPLSPALMGHGQGSSNWAQPASKREGTNQTSLTLLSIGFLLLLGHLLGLRWSCALCHGDERETKAKSHNQ